ncbi:MAG: hypothetical protein U0599_26565 [Vicinamibacteria bacterium]
MPEAPRPSENWIHRLPSGYRQTATVSDAPSAKKRTGPKRFSNSSR